MSQKIIDIEEIVKNLEKGELVLIITPSVKKGKCNKTIILGIFDGFNHYLDDDFIYLDSAYCLRLPFKTLEKNRNLKYSLTNQRCGIEFYFVEEEIVSKLNDIEGYKDYAEWISKLEKPYSFD